MADISMLEGHLQEIITKTTVAKGRKRLRTCHTLHPVHNPNRILGVTITGHNYRTSADKNGGVTVTGQIDIHVWFSHDHSRSTAVLKETVVFTEHIPVVDLTGERLYKDETVAGKTIGDPKVRNFFITDDSHIEVELEVEYAVEIIGEAKIMVKVFRTLEEKKDDDDWDLDDDELESDGSMDDEDDSLDEEEYHG